MMDVRADRQWLTAAEAAAEQLPGCPSKRGLQMALSSGEIVSRSRSGRGGGREFHWTSLPELARDEYLKRHGVSSDIAESDPRARAAQKDLQAQAREAICAAFDAYLLSHKSTQSHALKSFCSAFERRRLKLEPWVFETVARIAPHQVPIWKRRMREVGSLLDGRGRPSGSGIFDSDEALRGYVVAKIVARPHLAATHVQSQIRAELARDIPLRTLQHFLCAFRKSAKPELTVMTNPDKGRSHYRPAFGTIGAQVERINARWEIDASPADAMCLVDGRPLRMKVVGLIDVFTRRSMVLVSDQVRAIATMALLRRAILAWGLPELVKIDNGKEFRNRAVERFCADAGIETSFSKPFHPEEKPHIERFFGTLNRGLFEQLPGYIGHSVADRKGIEARRSFAHRFGEDANLCFGVELSPAELQARIDVWCERVYAERHHEGIALTPAHKAAAHAGDVRRLADERALDALMMEAPDASGIRTVGKAGIRIGNRFYIAHELGEFSGHPVHCRLDPHDGAQIVVYSADRARFLCVARDRDGLESAERAKVAVGARAAFDAKNRRIREDTRKVQALYPDRNALDNVLRAAQAAPLALTGQSEEAMRYASPPRLAAHADALAALEQSRKPESPIAATAEEIADATESLAEIHMQPEAPPQRMEQCSGYQRPAFLGDEFGLYAWLAANRETLDAQDASTLGEFERDETFQLQLSTRKRVSA